MGKSCLMLFQSVAGQYPVRPVFQAHGVEMASHTHTGLTQESPRPLIFKQEQDILTIIFLVFSLSLDPSFHNQLKQTWSSTQGAKFLCLKSHACCTATPRAMRLREEQNLPTRNFSFLCSQGEGKKLSFSFLLHFQLALCNSLCG